MRQPFATAGYYADHFLNDNEPPDGYFDEPLPESARSVTRVMPDVNIGGCSSYWPTMNVSLPRVRFIDGPYRPVADNDNREAHYA